MAGSLDSRKVREWQQRMARFRKARQSVAEFCRKEEVSAPSFYQWRKRLAQRPRSAEKAAGFRPVRLAGTNGTLVAAAVAVQLPGGTQLHVPTSERRALRLVIDTLVRADAQRAGGGPC
ncbi:MAG: IS66 family insertion sequence element accessory protein TnpA [Pirellulales bacterium]